MTIENSELNTSAPLRDSTACLKGGTGDGNSMSVETLKRGFQTQGDDDNNPLTGFAGRPHGWER